MWLPRNEFLWTSRLYARIAINQSILQVEGEKRKPKAWPNLSHLYMYLAQTWPGPAHPVKLVGENSHLFARQKPMEKGSVLTHWNVTYCHLCLRGRHDSINYLIFPIACKLGQRQNSDETTNLVVHVNTLNVNATAQIQAQSKYVTETALRSASLCITAKVLHTLEAGGVGVNQPWFL